MGDRELLPAPCSIPGAASLHLHALEAQLGAPGREEGLGYGPGWRERRRRAPSPGTGEQGACSLWAKLEKQGDGLGGSRCGESPRLAPSGEVV